LKTQLLGFDEAGEVFDAGSAIHRLIRAEHRERTARLYHAYRDHDLASKGIVETRLLEDGNLEHRKLVISYPYEWPASMYKDAALFHLRLFADLAAAGLTLKDALPNNVVFEHVRPVFVDFLSLIAPGQLKEEAWLDAGRYADARFAVLEKMLFPYLLMPLLFFARGQAGIARALLSTRSCNCGGRPPSWLELAPPPLSRRTARIDNYAASIAIAGRLIRLQLAAGSLPGTRFAPVIAEIERMAESLDVTPRPSAYSSYYDEKKEALSFADPAGFPPKQKTVHQLLGERRPTTVLDIGANTGWYSVLAAGAGAEVIALEEDESCADILYRRAKDRALAILPLRLSFGELTREIRGAREFPRSSAAPLYRAATERLGADMVFALGLLHHLVLGEGRAVGDVLALLARLAKRTLVLEFIDRDDDKIRAEPGFFPNLGRIGAMDYGLDLVEQAGLRYFQRVERRASHPASRTLLVFDR